MEAKFLISGDTAISVQLGDEIRLDVNQKVRGLLSELTKNPVTGVTEMVTTYASLMVHYKPQVIRFGELKGEIEKRLKSIEGVKDEGGIVKEIPN